MMLNEQYEALINSLTPMAIDEKAIAVNVFFNRHIEYASDKIRHGHDYVQTLQETLAAGMGDCDDIAVAKYTALKRLGLKNLCLWFCAVEYSDENHLVLVVNFDDLDWVLDCYPVFLIAPKEERTNLTFLSKYEAGVIAVDSLWGTKWTSVMLRSGNQLG